MIMGYSSIPKIKNKNKFFYITSIDRQNYHKKILFFGTIMLGIYSGGCCKSYER